MGGNLKWVAGLTVVAGLSVACGSDGGGGTNTTVILTKEAGDAQSGIVGTQLPLLLRVRVQEGGVSKAGATVTWQTHGDAVVNPTASTTSTLGEATTSWTLGTAAGAQTVDVVFGATNAVFTATAMPGSPANFGKASGDGQSAGINTEFGSLLVARVSDQYLNGIEGVVVNWSVQSGGVTLAATSSATNLSGLAVAQVTAGPTVGPAVVRATTAAVAGNADFTLAVTPTPVRIGAGDIFYLSIKNGTSNPAVDTAKVGTPVIWTASGGSHLVRSQGTPGFDTALDNITTGQSYTITFTTPGTYQYDCGVHGSQMTGRVVVIP